MSKEKKAIFLIILSFFLGELVMLLLIQFTPLTNLFHKNNLAIIKNKTKVYEKTSLKESIDKIYDAVVVVQNYRNGAVTNTGTGFVYKVDNKYGYLLTNEHVIDNAETIKVVLTTDEEIEATILGGDEYLDLAVLRIPKEKVSLVANIGNSQKVNIGDTVFAVGTPLGYSYRGSVTSGILSGKDRMVTVGVSNQATSDWVMNVLQIDASINPGNSGGPLLNINGEVIGICSLKLVDDDIEGMGFAIPIEYAMNHTESLEKGEEIKWPILGISMANIAETSKLVQNDIKIPTDIKDGVVVLSIKEGTSASSSSLKKGDIITKINGKAIKDKAFLRYEVYQHQSGETIEVTYLENNKEKTTKIKLVGAK